MFLKQIFFLILFIFPIIFAFQSQQQQFQQKSINSSLSRYFLDTEFDFTDKVILITGSSGGLGEKIAKEFSKRNANLIITGRRQLELNRVSEECKNLSPMNLKPLSIVADLTKSNQLKRLVEISIQKFGKIDILINNAGGGVFSSIYDEQLLNKLQQMINLNLLSVVQLTQLVVPYLEKVGGNIVTISSVLGQIPNEHFMPYCVAKAAVDMFCKSIAIELGPKGVRVNYVSPTAMRTNFQQATGSGQILQGVLSNLEKVIPLRRIGKIDDVANAVLFLASEQSSFITGTNLVVDGGHSLI